MKSCVLNPDVSSYAENDCDFVSWLSEGKKSVNYWHFCVFSRLETDHFRILEQVGYWKHNIQISASFLVLLENPERRRYKNGAKKSLVRVIVLFKSQIIRIDPYETSDEN